MGAIAISLLMVGCVAPELAYIHDVPRNEPEHITGEFSEGIQPNDLLHIYIESSTPESAIQFNQETNRITRLDGSNTSGVQMGYLVNQEGDIVFPVLGRIHVAGMTQRDVATLIEQRLVNEGYIADPVVTVRLLNFKVSLLGEVAHPSQLHIDGERVTIFEALAMAGDVTIYGLRDNVTVVREENGIRTIGQIDLTSKEVFNSPYYYLHQNDMVYVEPNRRKKRDATRNPYIATYISSAASVLSLVIAILNSVYIRNH